MICVAALPMLMTFYPLPGDSVACFIAVSDAVFLGYDVRLCVLHYGK